MTRYSTSGKALLLFMSMRGALAQHYVKRRTDIGKFTKTVLIGHDRIVKSLSYHRDGMRLVSGSMDGTVKLWNTTGDGALIKNLDNHDRPIHSVVYNPDGTQVAVASGTTDHTIKVWNMTDNIGSLITTLKEHSDAIKSLSYNYDGSVLASGSDDNTVKLWNMTNGGTMMKTLEDGAPVSAVAFNPDGTRLASTGEGSTISVWNITEGDSLDKPLDILNLKGFATSLSYNHDGSQLSAGSVDHISVWKTSGRATFLQDFKGHESTVNSISYSPDGRRLVSGGDDTNIIMWKMYGTIDFSKKLKFLHTPGEVLSISYSPDGLHFAAGLNSGDIYIYQFDATDEPTTAPTNVPTSSPSNEPTKATSSAPSKVPTTNAPTTVAPNIAPTASEDADSSSTALIVGTVVGGVGLLLLIYFGWNAMTTTFKNLFHPSEDVVDSAVYKT